MPKTQPCTFFVPIMFHRPGAEEGKPLFMGETSISLNGDMDSLPAIGDLCKMRITDRDIIVVPVALVTSDDSGRTWILCQRIVLPYEVWLTHQTYRSMLRWHDESLH